MESNAYYEKVNELLHSKRPFVSVVVVDSSGSVPGATGSKMLVTGDGWYFGTVGGGKLEKMAIEESLRLLGNRGGRQTHFVNWSLSRDVGMTCGGMVKLFFEAHGSDVWQIVVFGAGHVAGAVIMLLMNLECKVTCVDPREDWLSKLPVNPKLTKVLTDEMPEQVRHLPDHAFILLITMGHATDSPILIEALRDRAFPYVGVIGSAAKAARLRHDLREAGLPPSKEQAFFCPVGLPLGTNHPHEIAISIVAQLLQVRDQQRSV